MLSNHKIILLFRNLLPESITSSIHKVFKNIILKVRTRKDLQKASSNPPANAKRNAFLDDLRKTLSGSIGVFTTYVERPISLREHLSLISCILVKALVTGIVLYTLILVILGFAMMLS